VGSNNKEKIIAHLDKLYDENMADADKRSGAGQDYYARNATKLDNAIDILTKAKKIEFKGFGRHLYKVTLHKGKKPGEYTWLDWDKNIPEETWERLEKYIEQEGTFKDQAKKIYKTRDAEGLPKINERKFIDEWVENAITDIYRYSNSGNILYKKLSRYLGSDKQASLFLLRAGIDGIRYPAGSLSGMKDRGAKNYVVFDENAITIEEHKRYQIQGGPHDVTKSLKRLSIKEYEKTFKTGQPVTFRYAHNTESATDIFGVPSKESPYGRGYEPSGQYVTVISDTQKKTDAPNMTYGRATLNNPLVIENTGWKQALSEAYKGKTGKRLSAALIADGFDGVVTIDNGHTSEVLNLTNFDEGVARYQIQNVTQAHYDQAYKSKAPIAKPVKGMAAFARGLVKGADKMLGAISSRLERINPELKHKVRKLDFDTAELAKKYGRAIDPLLQKSKKMTARDRFDWDYARKNSDTSRINALVKKYGLVKEYSAYRKALDGIRSDAYDVGLSMGYIEDYAPRVLRDQRGFLEATGRSPERGIYSEAIRQKARNMGISVADLTTEQKANIVSNFILGGPRGIGKPSFTKKRQIKIIPPKYSKFYMNSDSAVVQYIYSMTKAIEARKFFGKVSEKVARMRKELKSAEKQEKQGELVGTLYAKELRAELERYALQRDFSADISTYITGLLTDGKITEAHEQDLHDILHARFHEHGATGGWQAYKNFSYIDTMGSPISALTQIGDLAWAAHVGGFGAIKHAVRSAFKRSKITKGDLGFDRIAQEFADASSLSNAVSKVFKYVGLEKIDAIGKEALINSAYDKYKKLAEKDPKRLKKEIQAMFGNETTDVITDLRSGDITDNVRLLLYNKVLDFQPMSLSEMPQTYLTAGNGRVFYMLKTFTLKQFDVFRTQAYNKIRYGNKKEKIEGMKNFVSVAALFVLANAAADELKDWLLDRETDLEDRVVDNLLRLAGVSKFVTWKARTEGVGSALARQILPPFKFIDAAGKDILNAGDDKGLEVMGSIPLVGKLYYWHMGRGTSKRGDLWDRRWAKRKKRLKEIKEKYDTSSNRAEYRKKNIAELSEYRRMRMVQKKLNKRRTIINRLKKRNPHLTERIDRLENQRTDLIKRYWERNEIGFLNR